VIRAVFGGSFDPVHTGHLKAVLAILDRGLADVIHVIPAWLSPHKSSCTATAAHRLAMAELVFAGRPGVKVEPMEVERSAPAYTADTLEELHRRFPADPLRLVMGADQLEAFESWHRPEQILTLVELIVLARQSGDLDASCRQAGISPSICHLLSDFDERVSASAIRDRLAAGEDPHRWLDPAVLDYIRKHGLYLR
jgi:nicotinate-nucleotide adenylyltransferase